jgi:O-acetyl-ADP-ribose deacetylase (regulator of RNase III)
MCDRIEQPAKRHGSIVGFIGQILTVLSARVYGFPWGSYAEAQLGHWRRGEKGRQVCLEPPVHRARAVQDRYPG